MLQISYPEYPFRIKEETGKAFIFDEVRKKWVRLTPEEWVRQNFLQYLVQVLGYPRSVIAVEKAIQLGELNKRCDIVVYRGHNPWMIIECKEPGVALGEEVVQQVLRYNIPLNVKVLVVTNGAETKAVQLSQGAMALLQSLPAWT